ncbi:MAG: hypothetical protein Q8R20_01570 [Nanoarchaeota archaeon]|nr:hypothetical protein [Nanoarchaeota archaeon]
MKKRWKSIFWILVGCVLLGGVVANLTGIIPARADENPGTNISSNPTERVAWSDISGWWDFHGTHTVKVQGTYLKGYASGNVGDISLDCATARGGNICASISNYGICNGPGPHNTDGSCPNGDATGILSGYAWNDSIGWISFNCDQTSHGGTNTCTESNYRVEIDGDSGDFSGYAWNDVEGWISFNGPGYKVKTAWRATSTLGFLESSVFDTEDFGGVVLNSIIWQGAQPGGGASVDFQIAASNCPNGAENKPNCTTGTWVFKGPDNTSETYYGAECPAIGPSSPAIGPNKAICVNPLQVLNFRYLRYRVRLKSNLTQTESPVIRDIILNWSK